MPVAFRAHGLRESREVGGGKGGMLRGWKLLSVPPYKPVPRRRVQGTRLTARDVTGAPYPSLDIAAMIAIINYIGIGPLFPPFPSLL
jgi:hypothetical protein